MRINGPGGKYDGTYNEDYEFVKDSGNLDECNGGFRNSKYIYYLTDEYPFVPRCLKGNVSKDFNNRRDWNL